MSPGVQRFARYVVVGFSTFLFDLALLYIAVSITGIPYYIATPCAFLVAVSINYVLSRSFVFPGSTRSWPGGYAYFILFIGGAAMATTSLVAGLVSFFDMHYMLARILVAGVIGIGNYLFNLYFNFKVAGKPIA